MAQGPEVQRVKRKTKAEIQAEETEKAAEAASVGLEAAIFDYSEMLKKPQSQNLDKLVLLLTTLKNLPVQMKLNAEQVLKLSMMQSTAADTVKIIRHFLTASTTATNLDWEGRIFTPSGPQSRLVRKQQKELVALPPSQFQRFERLLQNIHSSDSLKDDALKEDALKTLEQVREWSFYCHLAASNSLPTFQTYCDVKSYFANFGKIVFPPIGSLAEDKIKFDEALTAEYTADKKKRQSKGNKLVGPRAEHGIRASDSDGSDSSVDFSLEWRRFKPLSFAEMRRMTHAETNHSAVTPNSNSNLSKKPAVEAENSASSDEDSEELKVKLRSAAAAPVVSRGATASQGVRRAAHGPRELVLAFSSMKTGSAVQQSARFRDKMLGGSSSEESP
jgi:DNA-binding transcriptional regulator/RsmH inhibitor MraZ